MDENFRLKLELIEKSEGLRRLAAEKEALQAAAVDRLLLQQLEAKNKVLLQVSRRLLRTACKPLAGHVQVDCIKTSRV